MGSLLFLSYFRVQFRMGFLSGWELNSGKWLRMGVRRFLPPTTFLAHRLLVVCLRLGAFVVAVRNANLLNVHMDGLCF